MNYNEIRQRYTRVVRLANGWFATPHGNSVSLHWQR